MGVQLNQTRLIDEIYYLLLLLFISIKAPLLQVSSQSIALSVKKFIITDNVYIFSLLCLCSLMFLRLQNVQVVSLVLFCASGWFLEE